MSRKREASAVELGLLNGSYEWLADAEKSYRVFTRVILTPKAEKNLWSVRAVAEVREKDGTMRTVAQVTQTFPNSSNQTLAGLMLAMAMSIERITSHWALDQPGLTREAPQEG